jgi:hypothetical protein
MAHKPKLGSGQRFKSFTNKLEHEGYSKKSAGAIAASAGRKAHGAKEMAHMASAGKKRHSAIMHQK